jgi:rhodanese-related sulfurtransferase
MKLLLDLPGQLNDELLVLDLLTLSTSRVRTKRASSCPEHAVSRATAAQAAAVAQANAAASSAISGRAGANPNLELSFDTLDQAYDAGFDIVDIREPNELEETPTPTSHSRNIPMAELLHGHPAFTPAGKTLLVCASGRRSLAATQELRERGLADIYSLRGGVKGLQARLLT